MLLRFCVDSCRKSCRWFASTATSTARNELGSVCIIGSGPAGFYTSKYLLKAHPTVEIDMLDRLPTPFGLVRSGVAPDHQDVKNVQRDFTSVAEENSRFHFFGGLQVGTDICVEDLKSRYDALVFAFGAEGARSMGVPGENSPNIFAARDFVNWYNGHPDFSHLKPDFSSKVAAVIGNGNVAVDCARILSKSLDELATSDICDHALSTLAHSQVNEVHVVGRRGHAQAAFTMKELRELTRLSGVQVLVSEQELADCMTEATKQEIKTQRVAKKIHKLLDKLPRMEDMPTKYPEGERRICLRFLRSPIGFHGDSGHERVTSMDLAVNTLQGDANQQRARASDEIETQEAGLVIVSVGYKSIPIPGLPFDTEAHVVPNVRGRVSGEVGVYTAGWAKRGPTGVVATNVGDARETIASLMEDAKEGKLDYTSHDTASRHDFLLRSRGNQSGCVVTWDKYCRINDREERDGHKVGKPREKLITYRDLYAVAEGRSIGDDER